MQRANAPVAMLLNLFYLSILVWTLETLDTLSTVMDAVAVVNVHSRIRA